MDSYREGYNPYRIRSGQKSGSRKLLLRRQSSARSYTKLAGKRNFPKISIILFAILAIFLVAILSLYIYFGVINSDFKSISITPYPPDMKYPKLWDKPVTS